MARRPFDPNRLNARNPGGRAAKPRGEDPNQGMLFTEPSQETNPALTVTQLTDRIKQVLNSHMGASLQVVGEIGDLSMQRHWYFSLKDAENRIDCAMWQSSVKHVQFRPERGLQVVATGRMGYYGPQGRIQLYVDKLEPVGQGSLEMQFRQLCEQLRGLGYFDDRRKRPLPGFPERIAVVTSGSGAALQDVIRTTHQRWPGCQLYLVDVRVQGAEAAPQVASAINVLDQQHKRRGIDAVILTRGGGSIEDLWAFNDRRVADAIFHAQVPIVAAIGHETDTTIAELVADLRCSTPTQAAARLVPDARSERERLDQLAQRSNAVMMRRFEYAQAKLQSVENHPLFRTPKQRVEQLRADMASRQRDLVNAMIRRIEFERRRIMQTRQDMSQIEPTRRVQVERQRLVTRERDLASALRTLLHEQKQRLSQASQQLARLEPRGLVRQQQQRLQTLQRELESAMRSRLHTSFQQLADRQQRLLRQDPSGQVKHEVGRLGDLGRQLVDVAKNRVARIQLQLDPLLPRLYQSMHVINRREMDRLAALRRQLDAVGPNNVLERGYAYTTAEDGTVLQSRKQIKKGQLIKTHLKDGTFTSRVESKD